MNIVINPDYEYLRGFIEKLPVRFDFLGDTLYDGRNCIKTFQVDGISLNVKSFKIPNAVNKFIYGTFRFSKARRSFEYAHKIIADGIKTPQPVAYIEEKKGLYFGKSYYVSVHEEFDGMMREFKWGQLAGRENLLSQFAAFTANMHNKKILHLDYSSGNILYKFHNLDYDFYLVDLNRMAFKNITMEEGCYNLRRLWGSDEMLTYIAKEYARVRNFDGETCVKLVLKYHKKFWKNFQKRHKDKTPYVNE